MPANAFGHTLGDPGEMIGIAKLHIHLAEPALAFNVYGTEGR